KKEEPKKVETKKDEPKKEEPKKEVKKDEPKKDPKKDEPKVVAKDPRELKKFGPTINEGGMEKVIIPDDLYGVAWSKDAKAIVTAGYAGNISLWDLVDPRPKFSKKLKTLAYCVTFTPDGKAAISGHLNGFVIVTPLK